MSVNTSPRTVRSPRPQIWPALATLLDILAIAAWGALLMHYWRDGKLGILIHPNYHWMTIATGLLLLIIGVAKLLLLISRLARRRSIVSQRPHITLLPSGWSSALLLIAAILGFVVTPRAFASDIALNRGIADFVTLTRSQPQSFQVMARPEDRSIVDWIRTLNVYPEPDAYAGQAAKVQGFVVYPPNYPTGYFVISRFVITCCAADVYPVGLPVKLPEGSTAQPYPADQWLEIEGTMATEELDQRRQLVIVAKSFKTVPEPKNPYDY